MNDDSIEKPSKTALKKEMLELQDLGKQLIELSDAEFAKIPISDDDLIEAIATAKRIKSREGLRRQMQYIGKLMRLTDPAPIREALAERQRGHQELARQFHALEEMRDRLLEVGISAVEEVVEKYPEAERQQLRQLILQAGKEAANNKPPAAKRKLFKYLRSLHEHKTG